MEDDKKRILQDKQFHLQLKSEQKEIIQNVLERRFDGSVTHRLQKEHVLRSPHLILDKVRSICKSSPMSHVTNG